MDTTLQQYLDCADSIHKDIVGKKRTHRRNVKNNLYELESFIKQIQSVSCRIAQIYNSCKSMYNGNAVVYREPICLRPVEALVDKDNWVGLIRKSGDQTNPKIYLAPNIPVRANIIESLSEIPNASLYWVRSLNQFAICVNGVVFRGNVGNIYGRGECASGVVRCKHKNSCMSLLAGKRCKFYHDVRDVCELYKAKKITDATMDMYRMLYQNFTNTSWLYADGANSKSKNLRIAGSRNTLKTDLHMGKLNGADWTTQYQNQTFHDFLVVMAIHQMGMLEEYPTIDMISDDYSGSSELVYR